MEIKKKIDLGNMWVTGESEGEKGIDGGKAIIKYIQGLFWA